MAAGIQAALACVALLLISCFSAGCVTAKDQDTEELRRLVTDMLAVDGGSTGRRPVGASGAIVLAQDTVIPFVGGYADAERRTPITKEHVLLAGSIGKTYAAAVAFALINEGRLTLDDRVEKWLGARSWFHAIPNAKTMRVDDLLRHRSGIPGHFGNEALVEYYRQLFAKEPDAAVDPAEVLKQIQGNPARFDAGSGYEYSDLNYIMLGLVIEEAAGQRYYDLLQELFLKPLQLNNTYPQTSNRIPRLAAGYLKDDYPYDIPSPTVGDGRLLYNPSFEWTGGGLATTPSDLARWAWLLFSGRAMEESYLAHMLASPSHEGTTPNQYAAGARLYHDMPAYALGHGGGMPGYQSFALYFPRCDIGLALQLNDSRVDINRLRIAFVSDFLNLLSTRYDIHCE